MLHLQASGGNAGSGRGELLHLPSALPAAHNHRRLGTAGESGVLLRAGQFLPHHGLPQLSRESHPVQPHVVQVPQRLLAPLRPQEVRPPGHRDQLVGGAHQHHVVLGRAGQRQRLAGTSRPAQATGLPSVQSTARLTR